MVTENARLPLRQIKKRPLLPCCCATYHTEVEIQPRSSSPAEASERRCLAFFLHPEEHFTPSASHNPTCSSAKPGSQIEIELPTTISRSPDLDLRIYIASNEGV